MWINYNGDLIEDWIVLDKHEGVKMNGALNRAIQILLENLTKYLMSIFVQACIVHCLECLPSNRLKGNHS